VILKRRGIAAKGASARKYIRDISDEETDSYGTDVRRYRATAENVKETAMSLPGVFALLYVEMT
jgi:hypothetical protein